MKENPWKFAPCSLTGTTENTKPKLNQKRNLFVFSVDATKQTLQGGHVEFAYILSVHIFSYNRDIMLFHLLCPINIVTTLDTRVKRCQSAT